MVNDVADRSLAFTKIRCLLSALPKYSPFSYAVYCKLPQESNTSLPILVRLLGNLYTR